MASRPQKRRRYSDKNGLILYGNKPIDPEYGFGRYIPAKLDGRHIWELTNIVKLRGEDGWKSYVCMIEYKCKSCGKIITLNNQLIKPELFKYLGS